jgi:hypothetical protein
MHTEHRRPAEAWQTVLDEPLASSEAEPIGFAHNGFHVDDEQRFGPIEEFSPLDFELDESGGVEEEFFDDIDTYGGGSAYRSGGANRPSRHGPGDRLESPRANHQSDNGRHRSGEGEARRSRHYRVDPDDDTADYGRNFFRDS